LSAIAHASRAAPPHTGRIVVANPAKIPAGPLRRKSGAATTFSGLRGKEDGDDLISFVIADH